MTSQRQEAMLDFLRDAGWENCPLSPLPGDASTRRYFRTSRNGTSAMLMDQPQNAELPQCPATATPEERQALGYNAMARLAGADCGRFVAAADYLRSQQLSAPQIYHADPHNGFVLLEDFGDDLYGSVLDSGESERALYAAAIDALVHLHQNPGPALLDRDHPLHAYDSTAMIAETDLMTEWFMPLALGRDATDEERGEHRALWMDVLQLPVDRYTVFVHRDYHAQNLFWLPQRKEAQRVGMIDFQDAVAGMRSYDLVSLLEDARRDVPASLSRAMTQRYVERMCRNGQPINADDFQAEFAVMAAQRNAKIAGIFARLYLRDGKPRYLGFLPRVWKYLEQDLAHPAIPALKRWYDGKIPPELRTNFRIGAAA